MLLRPSLRKVAISCHIVLFDLNAFRCFCGDLRCVVYLLRCIGDNRVYIRFFTRFSLSALIFQLFRRSNKYFFCFLSLSRYEGHTHKEQQLQSEIIFRGRERGKMKDRCSIG
uniref:Secreted protein n=1 Tax=Parascaris univalens TaxID=6257 RepID=A0A915BZL3_PARUN